MIDQGYVYDNNLSFMEFLDLSDPAFSSRKALIFILSFCFENVTWRWEIHSNWDGIVLL